MYNVKLLNFAIHFVNCGQRLLTTLSDHRLQFDCVISFDDFDVFAIHLLQPYLCIFAKFLMSLLKAQVIFRLNFASIFSAIRHNSSALFLAQTLHTLVKGVN